MHPHAGIRSVNYKLVLICLVIAAAILLVADKADGGEGARALVPALADGTQINGLNSSPSRETIGNLVARL